MEHPGNCFGPILFLFPMNKVIRGHAHSSQGKSTPPGPSDSPVKLVTSVLRAWWGKAGEKDILPY